MLFDYLNSTLKSAAARIPEGAPTALRFDRIAIYFWEEHCIECGAPACYETCDKFERNPFGRCRRLAYGIARCGKAGAAQVRFKEWGKLELRCTGWTTPYYVAKIAAFLDYHITPIIRFWGLARWYYGFRSNLLYRFAKKQAQPNRWRFSFYNDKVVELIASIVQDDIGDVLSERISVGPGWHTFDYKVPALSGTSHFRISSITGTECDVVFAEMSVGIAKEPVESNEPAKFVKCVAWDLDNTLWDGILANDGPDGVKLRPAVVDVIKELDHRGILNTICSKNDYAEAWAKLEKLGIAEYFVFPRINWQPKSENLKVAAKEINIGINTFAFVDDSAHERGEVSENLPMVRVYRDSEIGSLLDLPCFNPPVSTESATRRLSYLSEMKRRKTESSFEGDHDAFLRSCEIVLTMERPERPEVIRRCWELVNRTNQLTLAAHRYTEDEFKTMLSENETYAIRCHDKYGDYGIVGFIAIHSQNHVTEFREFVMSCRVAMKKCEFATVDFIAARVAACGDTALFADVVKTGRNQALISAFDAMPNIVKGSTRQGFRYSLSFDGCVRPKTPVKVCLSNKSTY